MRKAGRKEKMEKKPQAECCETNGVGFSMDDSINYKLLASVALVILSQAQTSNR